MNLVLIWYNVSPFTICESEEDNSVPATASTPAINKPEPTTDAELEPARRTAQVTRTGPYIIPEPEVTSDQVRELATMTVQEGLLLEYEGMKWRPTPSTWTENGALIIFKECEEFPMPVLLCTEPVSSSSTELLEFVFRVPVQSKSSELFRKILPFLYRSRRPVLDRLCPVSAMKAIL